MNKPAAIEASLHSAMAAAFAEIDAALKSSKNPHFKSKYADITAVIESIKPALIKHGLFFTQRPEPSERGIIVETVLGHASGEEISLGKLFVPANKNDPQGFGSALTYARRYALVTAFGVPVEDDDGNAASAAMRRQEHSQEDAVSPAAQPINDADWAMLVQLVEATGTETAKICNAYGVASLKDFTPDQFKDAKGVLEKRLKAKAREAA